MEIFKRATRFMYPLEVEKLSKINKKPYISLSLKERKMKTRLSVYLKKDLQISVTEFPVELRIFHIENWSDFERYWKKKIGLKYPKSELKTDSFIVKSEKDFKKLIKNISSYKYSLRPDMFEFTFTLSPADFKYNEKIWLEC